ncbi:MAG: DMT family transporter [Truepera sp.]|nr:DMT family transporter [Truepera sp.]HRN18352.1 DMT family transporter [Trueperaceae bacterium]
MSSSRARAVLQALFVTFLWSTSWVLIKFGLDEIPALTFAGLRYALAFLLLLPLLGRRDVRLSIARLSRREWLLLVALGVVMYTLTQGAQFLALDRLPAQTTSLVLSFSPVVVAFLGVALLAERPAPAQGVGVLLFVVGAVTFLYPASFPQSQVIGVMIAVAGLFANAGAAVLGRYVNRAATLPAAVVTIISMGVGSALLLGAGVGTQGLPDLTLRGWAIVAWLAAVNTAFAFTLWNVTLRKLSAMESSIINNTMLIQIAILAWVFLGEGLGLRQMLGLVLAAAGTLVVQLGGGYAARREESRLGLRD